MKEMRLDLVFFCTPVVSGQAGQHLSPLSQSAQQEIGKEHLLASHVLGATSIPFRKQELLWMKELMLLYMKFPIKAYLLTVLTSKP